MTDHVSSEAEALNLVPVDASQGCLEKTRATSSDSLHSLRAHHTLASLPQLLSHQACEPDPGLP